MDKKSRPNPRFEQLKQKMRAQINARTIPLHYKNILLAFSASYLAVLEEHKKLSATAATVFETFLQLVEKECAAPHKFSPLHYAMRTPFDYYQFGLDFLLPLVDLPNSTVSGLIHLDVILQQIKNRENVIFFANHQIEADPQAISILLQNHAPAFAEQLFFVAGTRVISDPLAIPFSLGRNLLCIYSKKYIATPPEKQHEKQLHNKRTLEKMVELLSEGGHAIYVAPSGGRDRTSKEGKVVVAPFDPQSIELFYLMAKKATRPTHFYPLALSTHHLLPPPDTINEELGEVRTTRGGAIHLTFGKKLPIEMFPEVGQGIDKKEKRGKRALFIWQKVHKAYSCFPD